ncbi:hypothetical protein JW905_11590 [bacterium]|nr:hypothetical protein [candidate division CSSED10-310 bacterium]
MRLNREFAVPMTAAAAVTLVALLIPLPPIRFIGAVLLLLVLPFHGFAYLLGKRLELTRPETWLLGITLGFVFSPFFLFLAKALGYHPLPLFGLPALITAATALPAARRPNTAASPTAPMPRLGWLVLAATMLLILVALLNVGQLNENGSFLKPFLHLFSNPNRYFIFTFNFDFFKHLAFTNELARPAPALPLNPYLAVERLHYYWFYHIITAATLKISGIHMVQNQIWFAVLLSILFIGSALYLTRRFAPAPAGLVMLVLLLGAAQSYEYLRPMLVPREVGFTGILSGDFRHWLMRAENVDWKVSRYHGFFRNYLFLQHVTAGAAIGIWAVFMVLTDRLRGLWRLVPIAMLAVMVMYNSFIFLGFMMAIATYLLIEPRTRAPRAGPLLAVLGFLPALLDVRYIILPFIILGAAWFKPREHGGLKRLTWLLCIFVTGFILLSILVAPNADNRLLDTFPGLNILDVHKDIGHCGEGLVKPIEKHLWDVLILAGLLAAFQVTPLLLHWLAGGRARNLWWAAGILTGALLLLYSHGMVLRLPGLFKLLNFEKLAGNSLTILMYFAEIGPALPLAGLALIYARPENRLLQFVLAGFLVTIIALNSIYIFNPDDYLFKLSVVNKLFLCLLAAFGVGRLHERLRGRSGWRRTAVIGIEAVLLILAIPHVLQDISQHIDARTSCFTLDAQRAALTDWIKKHTAPDDMIQELPEPPVMDAFHHIVPVFFDRRAPYSDPWHMNFGTGSIVVNRVRQVLAMGITSRLPVDAAWCFRLLGADCLFVYQQDARIQRLIANLTKAAAPEAREIYADNPFFLYRLRACPPWRYETIPLPIMAGEREESLRILNLPFQHRRRLPVAREDDGSLAGGFPRDVRLSYRVTSPAPIRITVQVLNRSWRPMTDGYIELDMAGLRVGEEEVLRLSIERGGLVTSPMAAGAFTGFTAPLPERGYLSLIPHHVNGQGLGGAHYSFEIQNGTIRLKRRGFLGNFDYPPRLLGQKTGNLENILMGEEQKAFELTGELDITIDRAGISRLLVMGNTWQPWDPPPEDDVNVGYYKLLYADGSHQFEPIRKGINYFTSAATFQEIYDRINGGERLFYACHRVDPGAGTIMELVRVISVDAGKTLTNFKVHSRTPDHPVQVTGLTLELVNDDPAE